jgi:DNA repair protein RadC
LTAYHVVLAVKDDAGRHRRWRGLRSLTAVRVAIASARAIPPEDLKRTIMSIKIQELYVCDGRGFRSAAPEEVVRAARDYMTAKCRRGRPMNSPRAVGDFLSLKLGMLEHEMFCVLLLDKRNRLIEYVELFRGTIDGASVHPREVVKLALAKNAASVVFAHPHPSGVAEPSQADELITQRLKDSLALVEIRVLDHFIVAGGDVISMAERGLV